MILGIPSWWAGFQIEMNDRGGWARGRHLGSTSTTMGELHHHRIADDYYELVPPANSALHGSFL